MLHFGSFDIGPSLASRILARKLVFRHLNTIGHTQNPLKCDLVEAMLYSRKNRSTGR
jgi:hypothetical protein